MIEVKLMICLLLLFMPQFSSTEVIFNKRSLTKTKTEALDALIRDSNYLFAIVSTCKNKFAEERFGKKSYDVIFSPEATKPNEEFFSKPGNNKKLLAIAFYAVAASSLENAIRDLRIQEGNVNPNSSLLGRIKHINRKLIDLSTTFANVTTVFSIPTPKQPVIRAYAPRKMKKEKSAFFKFVKENGVEKIVCEKSPLNQCEHNVVGFVIIRDLGIYLQRVLQYARDLLKKIKTT